MTANSGVYLINRKKFGRPQAMLWSDNPGTLKNGLYIPNGYEIGANYPQTATADEIDQFMIVSDHNRSPLDFKIERLATTDRMINGRLRSYYLDDKVTISTSWDMLPSRAFKQSANFAVSEEAFIFNAVGDGTTIKYYLVGANPFVVGDRITVYGTNITGYNVKDKQITEIGTENVDGIDTEYVVIEGTATGTHNDGGIMSKYNSGLSGFSNDFKNQYTVDGGAGGADLLEWYKTHPGSFWVFLAYDKFTNFGRDNSDFDKLSQYNEVIEMRISDFSYSVEKRGGIYDMWNVSISLEEV